MSKGVERSEAEKIVTEALKERDEEFKLNPHDHYTVALDQAEKEFKPQEKKESTLLQKTIISATPRRCSLRLQEKQTIAVASSREEPRTRNPQGLRIGSAEKETTPKKTIPQLITSTPRYTLRPRKVIEKESPLRNSRRWQGMPAKKWLNVGNNNQPNVFLEKVSENFSKKSSSQVTALIPRYNLRPRKSSVKKDKPIKENPPVTRSISPYNLRPR